MGTGRADACTRRLVPDAESATTSTCKAKVHDHKHLFKAEIYDMIGCIPNEQLSERHSRLAVVNMECIAIISLIPVCIS